MWVCKHYVLLRLHIVCRYHSHPVFAPQPSQKDCENQRNYQVLFRCGETGLEPFLGVIIGPYHLQLPTPVRLLSYADLPSALSRCIIEVKA